MKIQLTPDGMLDLSGQVNTGITKMKLVHNADYGEYVFVLYLHPPTPAQSEALEEWRAQNASWKAQIEEFRAFKPDLTLQLVKVRRRPVSYPAVKTQGE